MDEQMARPGQDTGTKRLAVTSECTPALVRTLPVALHVPGRRLPAHVSVLLNDRDLSLLVYPSGEGFGCVLLSCPTDNTREGHFVKFGSWERAKWCIRQIRYTIGGISLGGMPMALKLRKLSSEEQEAIDKLAHSRTAAARLIERARIILLAHQGHHVPAIAQQLQLTALPVQCRRAKLLAATGSEHPLRKLPSINVCTLRGDRGEGRKR